MEMWYLASEEAFILALQMQNYPCRIFYILIREGIRFMQNGTPPVFVKCPRFETL